MHLSVVVLPAPLRPIKPMISPGLIAKETSFKENDGYFLLTFSNLNISSMIIFYPPLRHKKHRLS